jgi:hypothetical protein
MEWKWFSRVVWTGTQDYLETHPNANHDFDSSRKGTNRLARGGAPSAGRDVLSTVACWARLPPGHHGGNGVIGRWLWQPIRNGDTDLLQVSSTCMADLVTESNVSVR